MTLSKYLKPFSIEIKDLARELGWNLRRLHDQVSKDNFTAINCAINSILYKRMILRLANNGLLNSDEMKVAGGIDDIGDD